MRLRHPLLGLLVWALVAGSASAEPAGRQFTTASWTGRDGLPSSYVLCITQDRDGYLWVGTTAGASIFDGQQFRTWPRQGPFPSPTPVVFSIAADHAGSMWVAFGGSSRVARDTGSGVTVYTANDGLPEGGMRTLFVDHVGVVWAGGVSGVASFEGGRWVPLQDSALPPAYSVSEIGEDSAGRLWLATLAGVYRVEADRRSVSRMAPSLPAVNDMHVSPAGVTVTSNGTVHVIDPDTGTVRQRPSPGMAITDPLAVAVDRRGRTWLGTNGEGLLLSSPDREGPIRLTERDGLAGDLIRDIVEDRSGNLWVGTQAGLTRITEATVESRRIRPGGAGAENLTRLAAGPDGAVWVQSPDGLVRLTAGTTQLLRRPDGMPMQNMAALAADAGGAWVATGDGRLFHGGAPGMRPVQWPGRRPGEVVAGIAPDDRGGVWLYTGERLLWWNGARHTSTDLPASFRSRTFRFLSVDTRRRVWIGTDGLLGMFDGTSLRTYGPAHGLPTGQIAQLHADGSGRIWLASDNGLATLVDERFVTLTSRHGLPRDRVFFVLEEPRHAFWLGTGAGIVRLDGAELDRALREPGYTVRYRLFEESDGLRGTPVIRGQASAVRASNGSLWFLTSNGLGVIDPTRVAPPSVPQQTRVEQIVVDGRRYAATDGWTGRNVGSLQIDFAALHLTSPSKVVFRHRLEGVDADWVLDGPSRQARYANVPPGRYRLLVAASTGDGVFSEPPVTWAFAVLPMWYQTGTFYAGLGVAGAFVVWLGWQLHVTQLRRRFSLVLAERARVGREIHDTLLQSLVGLALQLDTLSDQTEGAAPGALRQELGRLRRQVERYIAEAQQSIWDLRTPTADTADFAAVLRDRAQRAIEGTDIALNFVTAGAATPLPAKLRQPVLRIVQEAIANAVRHAHPSRVDVEVRYESDGTRIIVADDGDGFDPDAPRNPAESHWGLSIMRERAEQVGARFTLSSQPGRGTRVELVTPPLEVPA